MINDPVNSGFQPKTPVRESKPVSSAVPHLTRADQASIAASVQAEAKEDQQAQKSAEKEELGETVKKLNEYVQNMRRTLAFSVEESTGRTVISVYDAETKELIRQIPPEETVRLSDLLQGVKKSLLVSEQA